MSKKTNTLTRRHFLKGAAYTSALSIGGLSSLAFANTSSSKKIIGNKDLGKTVTLFNQSDKTVALDASQPVSLQKVNGWIVVKINKASEQSIANLRTDEIITLSAGQQHTFEIDSELAPMLKETGDYVVMTNEFSVLNNIVPITTYDTLVA